MEARSRWFWLLLGRIAVYALCGMLACALIGGVLVALAGASVGLVLDISSIIGGGMTGAGAFFGVVLGGAGGALVGAIAFGVVGFLSPSRRSFFPARTIFLKASVGAGAATFGVMASYFILMASFAAATRASFALTVYEGLFYIMFIAPMIMMFGLIGGVIWGYKSDKEKTRRAQSLLISA
jgi:hypothetical protein